MSNGAEHKVTLKEIAEKVDVSISVVSRTLRNKSTSLPISQVTKNKILDVATEMGWRRNSNIGVIIPKAVTVNKSYYLQYMDGVFQEANRQGNGIFTAFYDPDDGCDFELPGFMLQKEIAGAIYLHAVPDVAKSYMESERIPYVVAEPGNELVENCIIPDDYSLFEDLLNKMLKQGYKHFYYVSIHTETTYTENVCNCLNHYIDSKRFDGTILLQNKSNKNETLESLHQAVKNGSKDTVFISESRYWTMKLLELFTLYGKRFPDDGGIVGNHWLADIYNPPLSTIVPPIQDMAKAAVDMINRLWANKNQPLKAVKLKGTVVIKEST